MAALVGLAQADSLYVRRIGTLDNGAAFGVVARGSYAYLAASQWFLAVSMADPRHPAEVGRCSTEIARGVDVQGDFAYVADNGDTSLVVISVADPAHPVQVARCRLPGAYSVVVSGQYAYASGAEGLSVVSIVDPTHPVVVGHCSTPHLAYHLQVVGDLAYVASTGGGLRIISVADPKQPYEIGNYAQVGVGAVAVSDTYAYIACEDESFRVLSIADPANPVEVGRVDSVVGTPEAVTAVRGYVLVASWGNLRVFSVADPMQPRVVAFHDVSSSGWSLALAGDYLYFSTNVNLLVLQFYQAGDLDIDNDSLAVVADTLKLTDSGTSTRGAFVFANTSASYNPDTTDGPSRSRLDSLICDGYLVGPGDTIDSITVTNLPAHLIPGQSVVCTLAVYLPPVLRNGDYTGSVTIAGVDTAHLTVEDSFYVFLTINRRLGDIDVDKDSLDVVADTIRLRPRLEVAGPPPVYTRYALGEFALTNTNTRSNPDTSDGPGQSPLESLYCTGSLVGLGGTIDSVFILNPPASLALGRTIVCTLAAYVPPGFREGDYTGSITIAGTDTAGLEVTDTFYAIATKLGDLDVARDSLGVVNDTIDLHAQPAGPVYSPYAKAPFMLVSTGSAYNPDAEDGPSRSRLGEVKVEVKVEAGVKTAKAAKSAKVQTPGKAVSGFHCPQFTLDSSTVGVYVLNLPESLAVGQAVECTLALVIPVGTQPSGYSGVVTISAYDSLGYQVQDSFYLVVQGPQPRENLDSLRVAPIPFKPNQNPEHDAIHFQGLSAGARVTVYDASGQTVWTATENGDGHLKWDAKVASGIYVYLVVSADGKSSKVGKLSVIR